MAHLNNGVAQLSQTSMPIGGINTNCVIAGHRGWSNGKYLKDIELIQVGDVLEVTTLWNVMHYKVSEIKVIMPRDVDSIMIQPGRDMITIVTCHPYGSGGRYRYLLLCDRVKEEFEGEASLYEGGSQHVIEQLENPTESQQADSTATTETQRLESHTIRTEQAETITEHDITISSGVNFESSQNAIFLDDLLHYIGFAILGLMPIIVLILLLAKRKKGKKGEKNNG